MEMQKILYVFDFDGVIADSLDVCLSTVKLIAREFNLNADVISDDIWEVINNVTFDSLGRYLGLDEIESLRFADKVLQRMIENRAANLFNGMPALLSELALTGVVCILSASHRIAIERSLNEVNIHHVISDIFGGETRGSKAEKLKILQDRYGVEPCACWMIGDAASDIAAARDAGCNSIAVGWGWQSRERLKFASPDAFVDSVPALHDFLTAVVSSNI